ncbi:MAG: adenosylcobinamide-phosphate synthase CbiB [Beijerinckiaceae bacterium]|nr:adenosylcobinamide-phosphate synthase CbiB [Beijerinckiaceae bacterium]MCI0736670.1 adenosylcobinamide-phosphate synthase CbiB [Beijerinckiaceae bacterium]
MDLAGTLTLAVLAVATEAFVGYPHGLFRAIGHPVTWIGRLIALLDQTLNQETWSFVLRRAMGITALIVILLLSAASAHLLSAGLAALVLPQPLSLALAALIASSLIAQRSLDRHVRAAADALDMGLDEGRNAVACIVGRDVNGLDAAGTARAAIESLAESFCDGVVAPAFWLALGGLPGGMCYKAVNTADSMIGHRTQRYAAFGFATAKLDDAVNFCPARLAALWIVIAAFLARGASAKEAWRIIRHDARGHPSPNAGWPEAAFAGALGLRLGGPRVYGDVKVDDAWIGSGGEASANNIRQALALYRRACGIHWLALAVTAFAISQV